MVKRVLIPVLVLAAFAAQGQSVSSVTSTRSYSSSASVSRASSYSSSSSHSSYGTSYSSSKYGSSARFSGGSGSYGSYGHGSSHTSAGFGMDRTSGSVYGSHSFQTQPAVPGHVAYRAMDDKYALAPIPKTVPISNVNPQRGDYIPYTGGGASGGGVWVNPFYTPGFSSGDNSGNAHDYQAYFLSNREPWNILGLPWRSPIGRRYIYRNYWCSGLGALCHQTLNMQLKMAKTPADVVEALNTYVDCVRMNNPNDFYRHFYPASGGWGW